MLTSQTLKRIASLGLDAFAETAVIEIVQDAVTAAAPTGTALALQLPADWPADYREQFWKRYPDKAAKPRAMKALDKVAFSGKTRWADLISGLERYNSSQKVMDGFIKNPSTWINDEGWNDQRKCGTKKRNPGFFEMLANGE